MGGSLKTTVYYITNGIVDHVCNHHHQNATKSVTMTHAEAQIVLFLRHFVKHCKGMIHNILSLLDGDAL
jgi:hypothetical protein